MKSAQGMGSRLGSSPFEDPQVGGASPGPILGMRTLHSILCVYVSLFTPATRNLKSKASYPVVSKMNDILRL